LQKQFGILFSDESLFKSLGLKSNISNKTTFLFSAFLFIDASKKYYPDIFKLKTLEVAKIDNLNLNEIETYAKMSNEIYGKKSILK